MLGWQDNNKRVYRLYQQEPVVTAQALQAQQVSTAASAQTFGDSDESDMDFVSDAVFNGRRLRALTAVDNYTRESLAIAVGLGYGQREARQMPVVFFIDPDLPKEITTITLAYTFFEVSSTAKN